MKDEIKNKLDALFVDDTNRKIKSEQKRNIEAEQQAAFIEQFRAKTDEVIAPAFEDFILYLRPNGWNGSVQRKSETPTGNNYGRGVTSTSSITRSARSVAQEDRGHPIGRRQRADANPCRREGGALSLFLSFRPSSQPRK
ncbi:MAG: hypothetical protein ABF569_11275 [Acetobacter sp.]|uniref:hypothetical protein n=1 Tax=Acetobacter sp. TaxID=440 RepID=UPI0039E91FC0